MLIDMLLLVLAQGPTREAAARMVDPLESVRATVEERLVTPTQTLYREPRVSSFREKKTRTISVSFRGVERFTGAENVRDMFGLIWQAVTKANGFQPSIASS